MPVETEAPKVSEHETGAKPVSDPIGDLRWWARDVFFAVGTAMMIVIFLYQPVKVEGTSMLPELRDQERIFVNKFVYRIGDIYRKDIVVFWYPNDPTKSYIKRVIGVPGDTVDIRKGRVFVNGNELDEPYIAPQFYDHRSFSTVYVQPGHYYVLGDHRNQSNDSRMWGLVPERYIYGKAVFRYWPMSQMGSLY